MFSPQDRIYNTPDVSVPATQALLQQIRLERVLKRFGYFACCKAIQPYGNGLAPPLVTLGPPAPTRSLRPFGAHEAFTGWQKSRNIQIPKPRSSKKTDKSTVPGYAIHAPSHQGKQTIGGCKYGGVHLSDFETQEAFKRVDIFKPFQPLKSPQRLPALQREKPQEPEFKGSKIHDTSKQKHTEQRKKKRNSELKKLPVKGTRKKEKKRKTEAEFMKWEASNEQYFTKSVSDLHEYVISNEKNHTHDNSQKYHEQIGTQIKQGVQQRLESFGPSGNILASHSPKSNVIHVLELEFRQ